MCYPAVARRSAIAWSWSLSSGGAWRRPEDKLREAIAVTTTSVLSVRFVPGGRGLPYARCRRTVTGFGQGILRSRHLAARSQFLFERDEISIHYDDHLRTIILSAFNNSCLLKR